MISVVIPNFNRGNLLAQTIESVLTQSYFDLEVIVVDDHSNDHSEKIVSEYVRRDQRVIYVKRPDHLPKGANSCRNLGFEIARGKYIKWLDSDDLLTSDALQIQVESLECTYCDLSICNARVFYIDPTEPTHRWGNIDLDASVSSFLMAKFNWHTGAGLWRKSYFSNVAPWQEGLMNSQEWLMHLTQLVKKINLVKVTRSLCLVRYHQGSMSHRFNKKSSYFYHECFARSLAFQLLLGSSTQVNKQAKKKIVRQFIIYQMFSLYKGSISLFLKIFRFYPSLFSFQFRRY